MYGTAVSIREGLFNQITPIQRGKNEPASEAESPFRHPERSPEFVEGRSRGIWPENSIPLQTCHSALVAESKIFSPQRTRP